MGGKVDLKTVPTAAWVFFGTAFIGVLAAIVILSVTESDATQFYRLLNVIGNLAGILLGGGSVLYAGAAARNSQQAARQTNGGMRETIRAEVTAALDQQRTEDTGRPAPTRDPAPRDGLWIKGERQ